MKKYLVAAAVLVSAMVSAQEKEPKLEAVGQSVKATYYHDNGQIAQQGYFKDGKADGNWIAYDVSGNKKSMGEYTQGQKSGKWFFWSDKSLSEVDYSNSRVANVQSWNQAVAKN